MISCVTHPGLALCIEQELTGTQAAAVLKLAKSTSRYTLLEAWRYYESSRRGFSKVVGVITNDFDVVVWCYDCGWPSWDGESCTGPEGAGTLCSACRNEYWHCERCERLSRHTTTIGGNEYCESCRDALFSRKEEVVSIFAVTLKQRPIAGHDPRNKVTGPCPMGVGLCECSDSTGAHHTLVVEAESIGEVRAFFEGEHITRIEQVKVQKI